MSIVRYDPFRDLRTLQEEVNRLFTGNIARSFDDEGIARGAWSPSVDIYENKEESDNYHRVERAYGSFTRSFTLPNTVTAEGANAEYSNGVLRVTLPKREETKARRIEIKTNGAAPRTIEAKAEEAKTAKA